MTVEQRRTITAGGIQLEWFDQAIVDLQRELARPEHADLRLKYGHERDFSDVIGNLAAEVGIIMDGMYTPEDIIKLCPMITNRLIQKRGGLIVIGPGDV